MKRERLAMIVITIFFWAAGAWYLAHAAREYVISKADVPAECTIVSSTVIREANDEGTDRYAAQVVFTCQGVQSTDHGPYHSHPVDGHVKAAAQARGFSPGQVVPCFRHEKFPSLVTVFGRDLTRADFTMRVYFGAAFMIIPIVVMLADRFRRRR